MLTSACGTVPLSQPPDEAPLARRIEARIGVVYTSAARTAAIIDPLIRMDVGSASIARLEKVFAAMFTQAIQLPDWPPWREAAPGVDAVIEVERIDPRLRTGNDAGGSLSLFADAAIPDIVTISYRICLYVPDATAIRCWSPSASRSHQRGVGECLDMRTCLVPLTESAMREAIARFMVEADNDAVLRAWSAQLAAPDRLR